MQCVDVEFKEKNLAEGSDGVDVAYPHRLVLLRPELLEAYRDSKLDVWLKARVKETQDKVAQEQQSVESELKEAASTEAAPEAASDAKPAEPGTTVINAEDFSLDYNPDAFVERKQTETGEDFVVYDPEAESTQNVRLASQYLRDVVLREFVTEAVASPFHSTDGFLITRTLHRKGINMRYLGLLVAFIDAEGDKLETPKSTSKEEASFTLQLLRQNLLHEMVIRAAKHVVNRHLRAAGPYDAAGIVSHLYNCLLGIAFNGSPVVETLDLPADSTRAWTEVTPASLRADLRREIAARYRYSLPEAWFDESMLKDKVLRELSLRVGVQLAVRKYAFEADAAAAASASTSKARAGQPNGSTHSSDAEPSAVAAASSKKGKKGKKGKAAAESVQPAQGEPTTFTSADVLNVAPVIKATQHRSALVEDMFFQGQRAIHENHTEVGEALVNDALHLCEQIFGAVHPEAAEKYHTLGIMWHNLAQRIIRALRTHEAAEQTLRDLPAQEREQYEAEVKNLLMPDPEGARAEVEAYLQQAVRLVRQSIVISERTYGIDSADAITQYSDLGLLEQQAGNVTLGLQLTRHAMDLYVATYGPKHPQLVTLLVSPVGFFGVIKLTLGWPHRAMRQPWFSRGTASRPPCRCSKRVDDSRSRFTAPSLSPSARRSTSSARRTSCCRTLARLTSTSRLLARSWSSTSAKRRKRSRTRRNSSDSSRRPSRVMRKSRLPARPACRRDSRSPPPARTSVGPATACRASRSASAP